MQKACGNRCGPEKTVVICTGGFHVQDIKQAIIGQLVDAVEKIAAEIVERLV